MNITQLTGLYESNVYLLEKGDEFIIIDAGVDVDKVAQIIDNKKVLGIFLTHGHYDHCFYANDYAKKFNCKIYAHKNSKITMSDQEGICSPNGEKVDDFSKFSFFSTESRLEFGDFKIDVFFLAGHCHCECGYLIDGNLFVGDFLFKKSFGRIDLKYSNKKDMIASLLRSKNIPYRFLYSGHGEPSSKADQLDHLSLYLRFLTRN